MTTRIPGGPARTAVVGVLGALDGRVVVTFALGLAIGVAVAAFGALLVAVGFAWRLLLTTVTGVAVAFVVAVACFTAVAKTIVALIVVVAAVGGFSLDAPPKQLCSKKARPMISNDPTPIWACLMRDELL